MINEKQYLEAKAIVEAYERQLQQTHLMGSGFDEDDEADPYCHNCGEDKNLKYNELYANGEYWTCKECGENFFFTKRQYCH